MPILLKTTRATELQIDEFLNVVSEAAIVFDKGMELYLSGRYEEFEEKVNQAILYERKADELRTTVEKYLYLHTLIPENRGDVLAILENTDTVIDHIKDTLVDILIEKPVISMQFDHFFKETVKATASTVEMMVKAVRAFFTNLNAVDDHIHKVYYFEKEADKYADSLKRQIFDSTLDLAHKMHLRFFVIHIEKISDFAQNVCDRVSIYTIKRKM